MRRTPWYGASRDSTWAWRLDPVGANGTRLVTRLKAQYALGPLLPATVLLMEIGDFPMMRRMLLGIRARAEQPVVTTSEEGRGVLGESVGSATRVAVSDIGTPGSVRSNRCSGVEGRPAGGDQCECSASTPV